MYNYADFKERFSTDNINIMLIELACRLVTGETYSTVELMKGLCGDSWEMLACIDRLVELGKLRCIYDKGARNYWLYVAR